MQRHFSRVLNARYLIVVALAGALLLSGCASVPKASPEQDQAAKQFQVPADKARIYVYRNESLGAAVGMPVSLNGAVMGKTAAKTYFAWDIAPGSHSLTSHTENDATLTVDAKPGQAYFVWQEVKMGFASARSALHLVDAAKGQAGVQECELIESAHLPSASAPAVEPVATAQDPQKEEAVTDALALLRLEDEMATFQRRFNAAASAKNFRELMSFFHADYRFRGVSRRQEQTYWESCAEYSLSCAIDITQQRLQGGKAVIAVKTSATGSKTRHLTDMTLIKVNGNWQFYGDLR